MINPYDVTPFRPDLALGAALDAYPGWLPARWGVSRAVLPYAPAFDPRAYGDPLAWWVADDAEVQAGILIQVPDRITTPGAFGALGNYLTAPLPTYVASAWNGGPGLVWTDLSGQRLFATLSSPSPADWSIALVFDETSPIDGTLRYLLAVPTSAPGAEWTTTPTPTLAGLNPISFPQLFGASQGGKQVLLLTKVANTITAYRDGVQLLTIGGNDPGGLPSVPGTSIATFMALSAAASNAATGGVLKSALIWGGSLTSSPAAVCAALAAEYGV